MWMHSRQQHGILLNSVRVYVLTELRRCYSLCYCDAVRYNLDSHLLVHMDIMEKTRVILCRETQTNDSNF